VSYLKKNISLIDQERSLSELLENYCEDAIESQVEAHQGFVKYADFHIYYQKKKKNLEIEIYQVDPGADLNSELNNFVTILNSNLPLEENQAGNRIQLLLLTFIVAMCSILYELLLAQSLSTTMGNTMLRYNITIGLYVASMGIGAMAYSKLPKDKQSRNLSYIELTISLIGGIAPMAVLVFDSIFQNLSQSGNLDYLSNTTQYALNIFNHGLIALIGFISGLELPALIDLGNKHSRKLGSQVLTFDYLGTLLGAIAFPIFILPYLSLFSIGHFVALLNSAVALWILWKYKIKGKFLYLWGASSFVLFFMMLIYQKSINQWMIEQFYFLGANS
jgi:spermidine synthase